MKRRVNVGNKITDMLVNGTGRLYQYRSMYDHLVQTCEPDTGRNKLMLLLFT